MSKSLQRDPFTVLADKLMNFALEFDKRGERDKVTAHLEMARLVMIESFRDPMPKEADMQAIADESNHWGLG